MSQIPHVDFRNGMVSEKFRRRMDLSIYQNSASLIENAVPLRAGGIKQREGLVKGYETAFNARRIIPLNISATEWKLVAFVAPATAGGFATIILIDDEHQTKIEGKFNYTAEEIDAMDYAQTFDMMVLTVKSKAPWKVTWDDGFAIEEFVPRTKIDIYVDGALDETKISEDVQYKEFLTDGYYPAGVCFVANRLCFFNFTNQPYRIMMSKPFEYTDFKEFVYYQVEENKMTSALYLSAVGKLQSSTKTSGKESIKGNDGKTYTGYIKRETTISTAGYYMTTVSVVDDDAIVLASFIRTEIWTVSKDAGGNYVWTDTGNTQNSAVTYCENVVTNKEVTTDSCAIDLELASDRDETVCWMGQIGDYVYVGTTSSEWVMPSNVTAIDVAISKLASYGSRSGIKSAYGMRNMLYVQSGARMIRSMQYSSSGIGFTEMTFQCPELFENGIRQIVWQRVPESRLYVLTNELNVIYVLCYDADYQVNAWCKWTFEKEVSSLCVVDTDEGQNVYVIYAGVICLFQDGVYKDYGSDDSFVPLVRTNNLDSSQYMASNKKNYNIYVDSNGTKFSACTYVMGGTPKPISCRALNENLSRIEAYSTYPSNQGVRIQISGAGGEPFNIYAVIVDMEVSE